MKIGRKPDTPLLHLPTGVGQEAGICTRTVSFTARDAANYTTILIGLPSIALSLAEVLPSFALNRLAPAQSEGWSPGSDSHRRIRVYETRPVAAEARGL